MNPFLKWVCGLLGLLILMNSQGAHAGSMAEGPDTSTAVLIYDHHCAPITFAMGKLRARLKTLGMRIEEIASEDPAMKAKVIRHSGRLTSYGIKFIVNIITANSSVVGQRLMPEGFSIRGQKSDFILNGKDAFFVSALDPAGAMYGVLDLAEQIRMKGLEGVESRTVAPRFPFRAIKFNLPWMSYRKHESLQLHMETCRDLKFWERFLDMMAENRYNALTLWNLHPFSFMIRPKNFPKACPFNDAELADWKQFWTTLFKMAKERGIETYMVNWNIFVSPEFAKEYGGAKYSADWSYFGEADTSELVKKYTKECVTQVIDEYPDLAGLGITLGERMGGMTPQQREDWLVETFGAGMKAASRPVKFIHRAPLSADKGSGGSTDQSTPVITRQGIDRMNLKDEPWVEMKFNWSHAYSSPRLCVIHGGKASEAYWEPKPTNYKITWMIRNEDIFVLRWGDPEFVRKHIELNGQDYVGGYFVGSECYIPAKNYIDRDLKSAPRYAFERQWLLYMLWGRLLYDPQTPDAVFENAFDERYGKGAGKGLLAAYAAGSRMPLRLGCAHKVGWDFTLYAEGFLEPSKKGNPFITIDDLIKAEPLDPEYVSIRDYVNGLRAGRSFAGMITPERLAEELEEDGGKAIKELEKGDGKAKGNGAGLESEIASAKAWAGLSLYFADKLRAGVALETYRQTKDEKKKAEAVALLEQAAKHWDEVIAVTAPLYNEIPLIHLGERKFSWAGFRKEVLEDIELARQSH